MNAGLTGILGLCLIPLIVILCCAATPWLGIVVLIVAARIFCKRFNEKYCND